jgi:hypothetical protein
MIRIMLIDQLGKKCFLECERASLGVDEDVRCTPLGAIPFEYAMAIVRDVAKGYLSGLTAGYRWYRQAG